MAKCLFTQVTATGSQASATANLARQSSHEELENPVIARDDWEAFEQNVLWMAEAGGQKAGTSL